MYSLGNPADGQASIGTIEERRTNVEPQVDSQRTSVFSQEHGLPADLWTQILDV